LQLAWQFYFRIAKDTCNSLYLYTMNANGQVTWIAWVVELQSCRVAIYHVYGATHCNLIVTQLKKFIFNYYAIPL
jgi:hypothetical protein